MARGGEWESPRAHLSVLLAYAMSQNEKDVPLAPEADQELLQAHLLAAVVCGREGEFRCGGWGVGRRRRGKQTMKPADGRRARFTPKRST